MSEYISRKTAYQFFKGQLEKETGAFRKGRNAGLRVAMSAVMNNAAIPAADVRPVRRGKWIKYAPHNSDMMTCSECEKYWILDGDQYDYHFCPNCGADMREES